MMRVLLFSMILMVLLPCIVKCGQRLCSDDETVCTVGLCNVTDCKLCSDKDARCTTESETEPIPQTLPQSTAHLYLEYRGAPVALTSAMFSRYQRLSRLVLSGNISSLGPGTFNLPALSQLSIQNTLISQLPYDAFLVHSPLKSLILSFNRLRSIPYGAFAYMKRLKSIDLSYNPIEICDGLDNSTIGYEFQRLPLLQELNLAGLGDSRCKTLSSIFFQPIKQLKELNLTESKLLLGNQTVLSELSHLTTLSIGNIEPYRSCPAKAVEFFTNLPTSLELIYAHGWRTLLPITKDCILSENSFSGMSHLRINQLDFSFCDRVIGDTLKAASFTGLQQSLTELTLSWTRTTTIEYGALQPLKKLSTLRLSGNQLGPARFDLFPANFTSNLKTLALDYLGIRHESISPYDASHLLVTSPQLKVLSFNGNFLTEVPNLIPVTSTQKSKMVDLRLDNNILSTIDEQSFQELCEFMPHLSIFSVRKNNIKLVAGFCTSLETLYISDNHLGQEFQTANLITISKLKNLAALDISRNGITEFPEFLTADMAHLTHLMLAGNAIKHISLGNLKNQEWLRVLDLSSNLLSTLDQFRLNKEFTSLYFQNNLLTTLPVNLSKALSNLSELVMFDILGNPFDCSCVGSSKEFQIWVTNFKHLANVKELTCNNINPYRVGNLVYNHTMDTFYCDYQTPVIVTGASLLAFIFLLPIIINIYKYRWYFSHPQIVTRAIATSLRQAEIEHNCRYDATVSYDAKNEEDTIWLIDHLIPAVEERTSKPDDKQIRLFIQDRDGGIGTERYTELCQTAENSHKIIIILSNSYARSHLCLREAAILAGFETEGQQFYHPDRILVLVREQLTEDVIEAPVTGLLLENVIEVTEDVRCNDRKMRQIWKKIQRFLAKPKYSYKKKTQRRSRTSPTGDPISYQEIP